MMAMPTVGRPDSTFALFVEGYEFVSNRCRRVGSDVFETRLFGQPTICMRGREAAELFYDRDRFSRAGAAPTPMVRVLFGQGGVQGMDGPAHRHRKHMMLSLMTSQRIDDLVADFRAKWQARMADWEQADQVVLYGEAGRVLTEAVHDWAGVPLASDAVADRMDDLHAMITGAGTVGAGYLRGRTARLRTERQLQRAIEQVRTGQLQPRPDQALHVVAWHRDLDEQLLDAHLAAVELLNVLRPTVAIDRYIVFCAVALHRHPRWRARLYDADQEEVGWFVQEVRRFFPFFPFAAARVDHTFAWNGYRFPAGRRTMLDLHATNHDPTVWEEPATFRPSRFGGRQIGPFELVAQGAGDHLTNHRCAGEWPTIDLMKAAVELLVEHMDYDVPDQELTIARGRVPALPRSAFVMRNVRSR